MAFYAIGDTPWSDLQSDVTKSRLDTAKAFSEMVAAKSASGEDVDPAELYKMKMSMTGGDPFKAQYIPSGVALDNMAKQANNKATMMRGQVSMNTANFAKQQNDFIQDLVYDNWNKSPDEMPKVFTDLFGPETGGKFYSQYQAAIPSMLDEAHSKKMAEVMQDPRSKLIYNDSDIDRLFPSQGKDKGMRSVLKNIAHENSRGLAEQERAKLIQTVSAMPEGMLNQDDATKRAYFQAMGVNADRAMTIAGSLGKAKDFDKTSTIIKDMMTNKELASRMYLASQTGNEDLILEAANSAGMAYGVTYTGKEDPNFKRLLGSINASNSITDIGDWESKRDTLIANYTKTAQAEAENVKATYVPLSIDNYLKNSGITDKEASKRAAQTVNMAAQYLFGSKDTTGPVFSSKENVDAFFSFVKSGNIDPRSASLQEVANAFMSSGLAKVEDQGAYITRKVDEQMYPVYGVRPGTMFNTWANTDAQKADSIMQSVDAEIKKIDGSDDSDSVKQAKKSLIVNGAVSVMTKDLNTFRALTNDPNKTNNWSGFSAEAAQKYVDEVSAKVKALKAIDLSIPEIKINQPGTKSGQLEMTPSDKAVFAPQSLSGKSVEEIAKNADALKQNLKRREDLTKQINHSIYVDANRIAHVIALRYLNDQSGIFDFQGRSIRDEAKRQMTEQLVQAMTEKYGAYVKPEEIATKVRSIVHGAIHGINNDRMNGIKYKAPE